MQVGDKVIFKKRYYKGNTVLMVPNRLEPILIAEVDVKGGYGLKQNSSWTLIDKTKLFWVADYMVELVK